MICYIAMLYLLSGVCHSTRSSNILSVYKKIKYYFYMRKMFLKYLLLSRCMLPRFSDEPSWMKKILQNALLKNLARKTPSPTSNPKLNYKYY